MFSDHYSKLFSVSSLKNFVNVYYFCNSVVCIPIPRLLSHSKIQDFSVVIAVRPCQILMVAATLSVLVLYVSPELDCIFKVAKQI